MTTSNLIAVLRSLIAGGATLSEIAWLLLGQDDIEPIAASYLTEHLGEKGKDLLQRRELLRAKHPEALKGILGARNVGEVIEVIANADLDLSASEVVWLLTVASDQEHLSGLDEDEDNEGETLACAAGEHGEEELCLSFGTENGDWCWRLTTGAGDLYGTAHTLREARRDAREWAEEVEHYAEAQCEDDIMDVMESGFWGSPLSSERMWEIATEIATTQEGWDVVVWYDGDTSTLQQNSWYDRPTRPLVRVGGLGGAEHDRFRAISHLAYALDGAAHAGAAHADEEE